MLLHVERVAGKLSRRKRKSDGSGVEIPESQRKMFHSVRKLAGEKFELDLRAVMILCVFQTVSMCIINVSFLKE